MALFERLNLKAKLLINTGFGTSASSYGDRFINKDGSANAVKKALDLGLLNTLTKLILKIKV